MRRNGKIRKIVKRVSDGMGRERGTVAELLTTGILVLAMTVLMGSYLESVKLLSRKEDVNQLARKYILRMETVGYLTGEDRTSLEQELTRIGVTGINLAGTTMSETGYGSVIRLNIRGSLSGKTIDAGTDFINGVFSDQSYSFQETRTSTAKN